MTPSIQDPSVRGRETRDVSGVVAWVEQGNFGREWTIALHGQSWLIQLDADLVRDPLRCTTVCVPKVGDNVRATFAVGAPGEGARLVRLEVIAPAPLQTSAA